MKIKASLEKVNEAIIKMANTGDIWGDTENGSFDVKGVEGRYSYDVDTGILTVIIDDKPWLATDSMIESEIRKFFN